MAVSPREQVEGWARDFDFVAKEVELDEDSPYEWCLGLKAPSEPPLDLFVAYSEQEFSQIAMQSNIRVSEPHLQALRRLEPRAFGTFVADLQLQVCMPSIEVAFEIAADPEDETVLPPANMSVTLGARLIGAHMTREGFYERYLALQVAFTRLSVMFIRMVLREDWP